MISVTVIFQQCFSVDSETIWKRFGWHLICFRDKNAVFKFIWLRVDVVLNCTNLFVFCLNEQLLDKFFILFVNFVDSGDIHFVASVKNWYNPYNWQEVTLNKQASSLTVSSVPILQADNVPCVHDTVIFPQVNLWKKLINHIQVQAACKRNACLPAWGY